MILRFVIVIACTFFVACSSNPNAIEPVDLVQFHRDTPLERLEGKIRFIEKEPGPRKEYDVKRAWKRSVGAGVDEKAVWLHLALTGDQLFAVDVKGRVYAFSSDRGKRLWKIHLKESISAGVSAGYGLVLLASRDGELIALSAEDGVQRWRARLSSELLAPAALGAGLAIVHTVDGRISAFDIDSGEQRWLYESVAPTLSLRGTSTPIIEGDVVYAGLASGKVVALNLSTGVPLWEQRVAEPVGRSELDRLVDIDGSLVIQGGGVFAATFQGKLAVLDQRTGRPYWDKDFSVYRSMQSSQGKLFLADDVSHVWAVDQRTSSSLWKQIGLYGRGSNGIVVHNDLVVTGDSEGYLHWMDPLDGRFVARRRHDNEPFGGPLLVRTDMLYALSAEGKLAAYRLKPVD